MHGTKSDLKTVTHGAQHCDGAPDTIMEIQAATSEVTEASQREVLAASPAMVSHMITTLNRNAKLWTGDRNISPFTAMLCLTGAIPTAIHEFVVPRSMPATYSLPACKLLDIFFCQYRITFIAEERGSLASIQVLPTLVLASLAL